MRPFHAGLDFLLTSVLFVALFCAFARPAYAYVDPGSGLFALQIISSTAAGITFLLRKRLRIFFSGLAMRSELKRDKAAKS
jgi:hypothetical protein